MPQKKQIDLYNLDELIVIFTMHKNEYESSAHYDAKFNLPRAFLTVCCEIEKLKDLKRTYDMD
jgi:hypothetical protein